jgi:spore coat protein A, manganese oxidase
MTTLLSAPTAIAFSSHLSTPYIIDARVGGSYMLQAVQTSVDLGLVELGIFDPAITDVLTTVYAYQLVDVATGAVITTTHVHGTTSTITDVLNPTFLTSSNMPINVTWMNMLPIGPHLLPYDASIMMSMGMGGMADPGMTPMVVHLHGAHAASIYDGYPTSTLMPMDPNMTGMTPAMMALSMDTYTYDNSQQATMMWYHDHSLGLTRLNVYAGLEGSYIIEDANRLALNATGVLPTTLGANDISLIIADRSFTADGQLYFPGAAPTDPLPGTNGGTVADVLPPNYTDLGGQFPTAVPEYYGDFIMVNNTAWPHAHVALGDMMFDLVNGSDSRFYTLKLDNANVKVTLVGVDGGLLNKPIVVMDGDGVDEQGEQIIFAPGDRLQLMFDFSKLASGDKVHLLNTGAAFEPFKGIDGNGQLRPGDDGAVIGATLADSVGQIMEFKVNPTLAAWHSTMTENTVLNNQIPAVDFTQVSVTRKLGIYELADNFGRIMPIIGTAEHKLDAFSVDQFGPLGWDKPVTELVQLGATEVWEFYNTTADAHPIHMHLGQYQVLGRYAISDSDLNNDGIIGNDFGDLLDMRLDVDGTQNLLPEDTGLQDTVWVGPGEAMKVIMTFDRPGDYVWHCHILSHEDHDMMRPIKVLGIAGDFIGAIAEDATAAALGLLELGKAVDALQGFVAGGFTGSANLGTLTMDGNLVNAAIGGNNGEWSYRVNANAQALAAGEVVQDIVTIHELDGTAHDIKVAVTGANDAPVVAGIVAAATQQNVKLTITTQQLLANSSDVDHGARLSLSGLTASGGALHDNKDGTWDVSATVNNLANITLNYQVGDGTVAVDGSALVSTTAGVAMNVMTGTAAVNKLIGLAGNDYQDGLAGNDEIKGNSGDDTMIGGAGLDQVQGGAGNDLFLASILDGNDDYLGGTGIDTYSLVATTAAATVNLATGSSTSLQTGTDKLNEIENVIGSDGDDFVTGDGLANILSGGVGNDKLVGGAGADRLIGGAGSDTLTGSVGNDTFVFAYNFGKDVIADFAVGTVLAHDTLDLRGLGFATFVAVLQATSDVGGAAVIDLGANSISLTGVSKSMLNAWDVVVA